MNILRRQAKMFRFDPQRSDFHFLGQVWQHPDWDQRAVLPCFQLSGRPGRDQEASPRAPEKVRRA